MCLNNNSSCAEPDGIVKACLSDKEIEKTALLLKFVWPDSGLNKDYLNWLYRENPLGKAEAYNVWNNGEIIAHYAAIPIKVKLFGSLEKGLLSLNTVVHPSYQGKGYFNILAARTYENAQKNGVNFVIGVANAISTVLFKMQLGFQHVCPLTVKIGFGAVKRISIDPRELQYVPCWDEKILSWRIQRPKSKYNIYKTNNSYAIYSSTNKYGIWANMYEGDLNLANIKSLKSLSHFRWNPLTAWIGLNSNCDWSKSLYITLPERFKPSPLNLVFKDLSGLGRTLAPEKILFSLIDFDAY